MLGNPTRWPGLLGELVLEAIYPQPCTLCGGRVGAAQTRPDHPWPRRCGLRPWDRVAICSGCRTRWEGSRGSPFAVRADGAGLVFAGGTTIDDDLVGIVAGLKYRGLRGQAAVLAPLVARALALLPPCGEEPPLLVPVPLHPRRRRRRGFNQATILTALVALRSVCPWRRDVVRRVRATGPQAGLPGEAERRHANVAAAFVARPAPVESAPVVVVDDLITTGATVTAVAEALRAGGWRAVGCVAAGLAAAIAGSPPEGAGKGLDTGPDRS